jgi:uncharacterized YccA/Bax inhibitor family protein
MRSSNPTLREGTFSSQPHSAIASGDDMTVNGTIGKSLILLACVAATFMWTWNAYDYQGAQNLDVLRWGFGASIVGMIMSFVISFKPTLAPILAVPFALIEGVFLGAVSAAYEQMYGIGSGQSGIVMQAMFGTVAVFISMLMLYRANIIKVTDRFRTVVTTAMMGVFVVYLLSFALSFTPWQIPLIHESGPIGIGFSVLVIIIASLMLAVDFDMIERGAATGAPKYMEWYGAFALLVTIVWIYLEILRLLAKLRSR